MRSAVLTLLSAAASRGCSAVGVAEPLRLPEVSFRELVAGGPHASSTSRLALSTLGALSVVGVPAQDAAGRPALLGEASREALGAWAVCLQQAGGAAAHSSGHLAGGAVRRSSVVGGGRWGRAEDAASALAGRCPPAERATAAMRSGVRAAAEALAAAVDNASAAAQMDVLAEGALAGAQLRAASGRGGLTFAKAVELGSHLEHIRLYEELRSARSPKQASAETRLEKWMEKARLSNFTQSFREHGVDAVDMLPDLSDDDLREVGLRLGHIKRFRSAVASQRDDEEAEAATGADADAEALETLSLHTDAGLMLAFVPPPTQAGGGASLVELQLPDGEVRELALPSQDDAVIFLAGEAARLLWRQAPADDSAAPGLRPAPHALRLRPGFGWRAWYGVMLLPPEDALVRGGDEDVGAAQTFGEMWSAARTAVSRQHDRQLSAEVPALGCGKGRLLTDQTGSCPDGEMECWMTCMSITHLQGCSGGTWRPSGVGNLAEWVGLSIQCVDTTSGAKWPDQTGEMCFTCGPQCELSDAAAAPSAPHGGPAAPLEQFCRTTFMGTGVTMYMDGFKMTSASPDETCVAFLLPSLVIDESWKLVLACLGVVLLSASVEVCSLGRRYLPKQRQGDVGIIFHMVSLVLAYFAMLFVMTYSVELFLSVIVGLAVGHKVAATVGRSQALDHGAGSPCCRLAAGLEASTDPRAVAAEPGPTGDAEGLVTVRLAVKGMTCGACVETVRRALAGVEGAHSATVSLQDASAEVLCKPSSTIAHRLCEACSCIGFDAQAANRRL